MATRYKVLDEGFDLYSEDEIPTYGGSASGRASAIEKAYQDMEPGAVRCIRQYEAKESASGAASGLRKRHPDAIVKVGPVSGGLHGLFVVKPEEVF